MTVGASRRGGQWTGPTRAVLLVLAVAGCGGTENFRDAVGLNTPPPDEFLVVSRAPLQMPPRLDALPPPQPGAPSRVEPNPQAQAQAALAGRPIPQAAAPSGGEQALLAAVGPADPAVRSAIRSETAATPTERRFGLDSFFGFPINQNPGAPVDRLDPREEAERLRTTGAAVPVIPPDAPAP
jgi:hypothetical protein